jgi:glycosyltransferase involved in cell wall biosynthesis
VKRIAHVLPFAAVGGTEHATLRIARAVDPSRFTSIALHVPGADAVRALFTGAGVPCTVYEPAVPSYRYAAQYVAASLRIARELKRQRVDLVHCADLLAAHHAGLAGWLARIPVLCHIRNRFDAISRRDCSFLWPVRRFVFVSRNTWRQFSCPVAPSRGVVVYDGIDVSPSANGAPGVEVRGELGIPADAPLVGMIARVAAQKDYPTLAKAAARVLAEEPGARFVVVGDHSSEANQQHFVFVRKVLDDCGVGHAFVFTGQRTDIARLLRAFDLFVLSTHWEGLPLVILEAMSQATPVIATDVDGIPEIVTHGETGLLFPHEDDRQLAADILSLLRDRDRAEGLGRAAQRLVQAQFTTRQFAASMNDVYSRLLGV